MPRITFSFIGLILSLITLSACKNTEESTLPGDIATIKEIRKENNKLQQLAMMFEGYFSNEAHLDGNSKNKPQELMGRRIWKERTDAAWVYMGWYSADFYGQPLMETVLKIHRNSPDSFSVDFFYLPESIPFEDLWLSPKIFYQFNPNDLKAIPQCQEKIVKRGNMRFELVRKAEPCILNLEGSIRTGSFSFILEADKIIFNNTFYDPNHNIVLQGNDSAFDRKSLNQLKALQNQD